jgi:MFS family permease
MRTYVLFNVLFTSFIAQVFTTLPLYFKNFVHYNDANGLPYPIVCSLFAGYILVMAIFQLPSARRLARFKRTRVLMFACVLELLAFLSVWIAGASKDTLSVLMAASAAVALFALGNAVYNPVASALVVGLATAETRGVYLSANSLCWALGLCIGPVLGLAALDHSLALANALWLALAASCLVAILILVLLEPKLPEKSLSG